MLNTQQTEVFILNIPSMHCGACARRIDAALRSIIEIGHFDVHLNTKSVSLGIDVDDTELRESILNELKAIGYDASVGANPTAPIDSE